VLLSQSTRARHIVESSSTLQSFLRAGIIRCYLTPTRRTTAWLCLTGIPVNYRVSTGNHF